jgi:lambda family phage portal protein
MQILKPLMQWTARRYMGAFYEAASTTLSRIAGFRPSNTEVNQTIIADGDLMRARSRKMERENPYVSGALDTFTANAVGSGITPRSLHPDPKVRQLIRETFEKWTKQADANGTLDFYGLETLACRTIQRDGEVLIRKRFRRLEDGLTVPFQLQLIEADHLPYWKSESTPTGYTRAGIEFDLIGRRQAYHLYRDHPGGNFPSTDANLYRVPADQILHCYQVKRPGQIRGVPWITPTLVKLYDLNQLMDAALVRTKVSMLLSVWIKSTGGGGFAMPGETSRGNGTVDAQLEPGAVLHLKPGEDPEFLTPPEPGIGFEAFVNQTLRAVAKGLGLTYEQLTGDLSNVNYSSIRAGILEFRRWCEAYQYQVLVFQFCEQIWPDFMQAAMLAGAFPAELVNQYAKDPAPFLAHEWDTPGWPWVDPAKEVQAAKDAIRSGLSSRVREVGARGVSSEQIDKEQAADNTRADDLGLKYDSDGRVAAAGAAAASSGTTEPPPDLTPAQQKKQTGATHVDQLPLN